MSTLICYDTFFPEVVRKATAQGVDFFIVPANPPRESVPRFTALHLSQTIFRAVENHTAIVLSYSNGISALIDSNGRLLLHEPLNPAIYMYNSVAMSGALPVHPGGTFYSRWGDVFIWAVLFLSIAYAIGVKIRQISRGSQVGQ
jgi:apolipoprotein N-acyltransferase